MRYRIVHKQWFDEKALPDREHWIIETLYAGLFGDKWKPVKHLVCYGGDCSKRTTEFKSVDEARQMIGRLQADTPVTKWVSTVVESVSTEPSNQEN